MVGLAGIICRSYFNICRKLNALLIIKQVQSPAIHAMTPPVASSLYTLLVWTVLLLEWTNIRTATAIATATERLIFFLALSFYWASRGSSIFVGSTLAYGLYDGHFWRTTSSPSEWYVDRIDH